MAMSHEVHTSHILSCFASIQVAIPEPFLYESLMTHLTKRCENVSSNRVGMLQVAEVVDVSCTSCC